MSHWIPGDVLMSAAGMRNVFKCCVVPSRWAWGSSGCWPLWVGSQRLHSRTRQLYDSTHEPGDPLIITLFFLSWNYLVEQSLPSDRQFPEETGAQTGVHCQRFTKAKSLLEEYIYISAALPRSPPAMPFNHTLNTSKWTLLWGARLAYRLKHITQFPSRKKILSI